MRQVIRCDNMVTTNGAPMHTVARRRGRSDQREGMLVPAPVVEEC